MGEVLSETLTGNDKKKMMISGRVMQLLLSFLIIVLVCTVVIAMWNLATMNTEYVRLLAECQKYMPAVPVG